MSSWGASSKISKLEQVGDFFIFGPKSSPFYFTSRWEAFFCEKLEKEEPFFFLIFFVFCRYCADCSSKLPYIRVFLKKFDGIFFFSTRHLQYPFGVQRQKPYEEAEGRASAKREFDGI